MKQDNVKKIDDDVNLKKCDVIVIFPVYGLTRNPKIGTELKNL